MILGVCVDKDKTALNSYVKKNPLNFKVINTSRVLQYYLMTLWRFQLIFLSM